MMPERLTKSRNDKNWTLKELSVESNVAYEQISRYESGKSQPNKAVLIRLANALNVSIEYLQGASEIKYQDLTAGPSDEHLHALIDKIKSKPLTSKERRVLADFLELLLAKKEIQQVVLT